MELKREVAGTSRIEGADFTEREFEEAVADDAPDEHFSRSQRQARAAINTYRWIEGLTHERLIDESLIKEIHGRIVTGCDDDHCPPGQLRGDGHNVSFGRPRHRGVEGGPECSRALMSLSLSSTIFPAAFASGMVEVRVGASFPSSGFPFAATVLPCRHIVPSPCRRDGSTPLGDAPGRTSPVPRRAQRRVHTLIRFGWPADAGPVTMMPNSGGATFREAGPICDNGAASAANHAHARSHALPGFPGGPVGPPGCSAVRCPPLRPATGRRLPAPARWWRNATAPPAACAPAPRSPRLRERPSRALT